MRYLNVTVTRKPIRNSRRFNYHSLIYSTTNVLHLYSSSRIYRLATTTSAYLHSPGTNIPCFLICPSAATGPRGPPSESADQRDRGQRSATHTDVAPRTSKREDTTYRRRKHAPPHPPEILGDPLPVVQSRSIHDDDARPLNVFIWLQFRRAHKQSASSESTGEQEDEAEA